MYHLLTLSTSFSFTHPFPKLDLMLNRDSLSPFCTAISSRWQSDQGPCTIYHFSRRGTIHFAFWCRAPEIDALASLFAPAFLRFIEPSLLLISDSSCPTVTDFPFDRGTDSRFFAYQRSRRLATTLVFHILVNMPSRYHLV
jgi:hypothetical protein